MNSLFKLFIRRLVRHKAYSVLNIAGLSVGIGISLLMVAWITVGYRAVRAALVNPVKSLKAE